MSRSPGIPIACALVALAGALAWPATDAAAQAAPRAEARNRAAQSAQRRGDYGSALRAYDTTLAQPRDSIARSVRARALLGKGRTYDVLGQAGGGERALLDSAETYYRLALKSGDADARSVAGIGLGAVQLRRGDASAAVQTLRNVDGERLSPPQLALRDYHLARALVATGDTVHAAKAAEQALRNGAADDLVVREAFGLLLGLGRAKGTSAAQMGLWLLEAGRPATALQNLEPCLDRWGDSEGGLEILAVMLRAHSRLGLDADNVHALVRRHSRRPELARALADVTRAYEGEFGVPQSESDLRGIVPAWLHSRQARAGMSEFLYASASSCLRDGLHRAAWTAADSATVRAGDRLRRAPRTGADSLAALSRYVAAFQLDRSNALAAFYAASLLASGRLRDVPSPERLIDQLVRMLFIEKGSAYRANDYPVIVRLHYVLARIFDQPGWAGPQGGTHSVVFQLEHAIEVQERGNREGVAMPPIPGLHAWLAEVYERGDPATGASRERVAHQYLLAAREFARGRSREDAEDMLARAGVVPARDEALLADVRRLVEALPAERD